MKLNWGFVFGGISALAGVVYVLQSRNQQPPQTVSNVFPPLNTPDGTVDGTETGLDNATVAQPSSSTTTQANTTGAQLGQPVRIV